MSTDWSLHYKQCDLSPPEANTEEALSMSNLERPIPGTQGTAYVHEYDPSRELLFFPEGSSIVPNANKMNWEPFTFSIPEQEWEDTSGSQLNLEDFMRQHITSEVGDPSGNARARDVAALVSSLKAEQETPLWFCSVSRYNLLRYYAHLAKAYPHPTRKLRKCHMRKRYLQMRRERRRFL